MLQFYRLYPPLIGERPKGSSEIFLNPWLNVKSATDRHPGQQILFLSSHTS